MRISRTQTKTYLKHNSIYLFLDLGVSEPVAFFTDLNQLIQEGQSLLSTCRQRGKPIKTGILPKSSAYHNFLRVALIRSRNFPAYQWNFRIEITRIEMTRITALTDIVVIFKGLLRFQQGVGAVRRGCLHNLLHRLLFCGLYFGSGQGRSLAAL